MAAAPASVDCLQLHQDLIEIKGVDDVRDLHAWCVTPGQAEVSARIHVTDESMIMDVSDRARIVIKHKHGISKCTLEVTDDAPPPGA